MNTRKLIASFTIILLLPFLFLSSFGKEMPHVALVGVGVSFFIFLVSIFSSKRFSFPRGTILYTLFLFVFIFNLIWFNDPGKEVLSQLLFFISGLFLWVASFNLRKDYQKIFVALLFTLGILLGVMYIYQKIKLTSATEPLSLFLPVSGHFNHNHIGDYWAIVLVPSLLYLFEKRKPIYALLSLLGLFFLVMSFSRSAYVAILAGLVFLFYKQGKFDKYKKVIWLFFGLMTILFLVASTQKTLLFSRQYWVQGVLGLIDNPMGVGYGNFGEISKNTAYHIWNLTSFSRTTHNIFLEILVGIGYSGVLFILFFIFLCLELMFSIKKKEYIYQAMFVALSVNFFFDFTYLIPSMLFIWFMLLGLSQEEKESLTGYLQFWKQRSRSSKS